MGTILGLLKKMQDLDTDKVIQAAVSETVDAYANLNAEQMHHGIDADGAAVGYYGSTNYAELKNIQNPLPGFGVADLRLTGDFYAGIKTEVIGEKVITKSSDWKNDMLVKKYGNIFGLSEKYRQEYIKEFLRPNFKTKIQAATGLTMR